MKLQNSASEQVFNKSDFISIDQCPACNSRKIENLGSRKTIHPQSSFSVSLIRCLSCEHWSTNPLPTAQLLTTLYSESSLSVLGEGWSEHITSLNEDDSIAPDNDWVVKGLLDTPPGNFLEIGPGDGSLLRKMRALGWNAFGVDLGEYAKGFQVVSSPDQLPDSIKFDVIVFKDVLEHVSTPKIILNSYLPNLTSDAKLFIGVPWSESKRAQTLQVSWEMVRPLGHLHYFSKQSIKTILKEVNFNVITTSTENIYGSYPRSLARSLASLAAALVFPSRWNTADKKLKRIIEELSIFPGDPAGDQLHIKAQREII